MKHFCPSCRRQFAKPVDLGRHLTAKASCLHIWEAQQQQKTQKKVHRTRLRIGQKCKILDDLVELEEQTNPLAASVVRIMHPSISAKNISTWSGQRELLFFARDQDYSQSRNLLLASRVRFPAQEVKTYMGLFGGEKSKA